MSVERPTFHESWHRVAGLKPRLRAGARVRRQTYRGQVWHIVEDSAGLQFFRLSDPAWRFVGLLDGRRTVAEAWRSAEESLGDAAPTQGETIQILAQLYGASLLHADLPGDAESLFRLQRKRVTREVRGYLMNLFFLRVPLFDPDPLLKRLVPIFGGLFSWAGLVLWLALLGVGAYHLLGRWDDLAAGASSVLAPSNLPLLYLSFAVIKALHELGHGLACRTFGMRTGDGGEVHTIGLMFLVFMPVPYVDATSSWAFRSKLHRVLVASAGMIVELAVAAVAAVVWARTGAGEAAHAIAYNAIFLAGVSTLLFNGNPLMRYDGYYILSDLLDLPNLAQRSQEMLRWVVRRKLWGVRRLNSPAHSGGEGAWLGTYAVASVVYRVIVYVGIALFIADQQLLLGVALLLAGLLLWVLVPLGKFLHYLLTSPELERTRGRAILTTLGAAGALTLALGVVPAPDHVRANGVVEPEAFAIVHAGAEGFVESHLPSGAAVAAGDELVAARNAELATEIRGLEAELDRLRAARRKAIAEDPAEAQRVEREIAALADRLAFSRELESKLITRAPIDGAWISPDLDTLPGAFVERGTRVGVVASMERLVVRAVATQRSAGLIQGGLGSPEGVVEVRPLARPEGLVEARIERILPAGQERLPSASLGFAAGGAVQTRADDDTGTAAAEPVFEVRLALDEPGALLPGQRVVARFRLRDKPLLAQWWRTVRQVAQDRFRI